MLSEGRSWILGHLAKKAFRAKSFSHHQYWLKLTRRKEESNCNAILKPGLVQTDPRVNGIKCCWEIKMCQNGCTSSISILKKWYCSVTNKILESISQSERGPLNPILPGPFEMTTQPLSSQPSLQKSGDGMKMGRKLSSSCETDVGFLRRGWIVAS